MFKTFIVKPTVITAAALLVASLVGVHNAKAAEQGGFGNVDTQEQARRLLAGPVAGSNDGPAYIGAMQVLKPQEVDAHKQAERLLSAPLPY